MSRLMAKPTYWHVRPAKTQISLGICPVWSESSLCAQWVAKDPSFLNADSEDSDKTGRMPRLIWVFAGHTVTLLVLSCCGSCWLEIFLAFYLIKLENQYLTLFSPMGNAIEPFHEKTCFSHRGTTKAHTHSLMSSCLDSIIPILAKSKISRLDSLSRLVWVLPGRKLWRQVFLWRGSNHDGIFSGGSRGGSFGVHLNPLLSLHYFIFMGNFRKNWSAHIKPLSANLNPWSKTPESSPDLWLRFHSMRRKSKTRKNKTLISLSSYTGQKRWLS